MHRGSLLRCRAGLLDDLAPLDRLAGDEGRKLGWRLASWFGALLQQLFLDVGVGQRLEDRRVQLCHDRGRRPGRRQQAEPRCGFVARHAGFGDCRHVGQCRRALRRGDGQGAQLAGFDVADRRRHIVEHDRDVVAQQVIDGRRTALVGHVLDVDAGHLLEQFAGQVDRRAAARRAERDLAGIGLGIRHQLLDGLERLRRIGHQQVRHQRHARERGEILDRIEPQFRVQALVDGVGADRAHEDRVAIGRGARHELGADIAAGAGAVVDDDRLAKVLADELPQHARQDVGGAAGRERDDDRDGLGGEGLGLRRQRRQGQQAEGRRSGEGEGTAGRRKGA